MTTKTKPTAFISRSQNQQVVIRAGVQQQTDPLGNVIVQKVDPIYANFQGNRFETTDPEVIKRLREIEGFGKVDGWWEEGDAPDEPKPTQGQQVKAINKLTAKADVDGLHELIEAERAKHNRQYVIDLAEDAISNIEVPASEARAAVARQDEPAESGQVPRVDPVSELTDEDEREKVRKSEKVAEARGEAAGDEKQVSALLDAESKASTAAETEKAAKPKSEGKATSSKSTAKGKKSGADSGSRAG